MHYLGRANHIATISCTNTLQAQADTEYWDIACKTLDGLDGNTRLGWGTRTRRYTDELRSNPSYVIDGYFVITINVDRRSQLPKILNDIPRERVVVVDHQNIGATCLGILCGRSAHRVTTRSKIVETVLKSFVECGIKLASDLLVLLNIVLASLNHGCRTQNGPRFVQRLFPL